MRPRYLLSLAVASVVSPWPAPLFAQSPAPVPATPATPTSGVIVVPGVPLRVLQAQPTGAKDPQAQDPQATAAAQDPAKQDPAAAAAAAAATQRQQKFQQLQYDRRPSTVLKVWSLPELKPYDPSEEKDKPKDGEAGAEAASGEPGVAGGEAGGVVETVVEGGEVPPEVLQRMVMEQLGAGGQPVATGEAGAAATQPGGTAAAAAAAAAAQKEKLLAEKRLQREMEMLQRDVTLGRWHKVGAFLGTLPEKDRKKAYEHFLKTVPNHPQRPEDQRIPPNLQEKNRFSFDDALAIAGIAPGGFDKKQAALLAPLVRRAIESGSVLEELIRLLTEEVGKPEAEQRLDRREVALLLTAIGQDVELGVFLPTPEQAQQQNDREGLNLLARHALAMFQKEQRNSFLETAWNVTQAALAQGEVGEAEKAEALRRAVELAPKVRAELGPAWLADSFTKWPERGMEIVAVIGGQVAKGFGERPGDTGYRATGLRLQKTAVDALLAAAPQLGEQWRPTLGMLASGWIAEAAYSYQNSESDSWGPMMERDDFGNIFYSSRRRGGGGQAQAVEPVDLIESQPGEAWASLLDPALQPHFATVSAQLWLKVNEPQKAFPYIEQLAKVNPRKGKELANEFLRVWIRNANPNADNRVNSYMFMYGFDQRSNGIPLTRSKQERNLEELGSWVERLRQLPIGGVDDALLSEAFVTAHSAAEVYRLETMEKVFGDIDKMDPQLLGQLLGKMRTNLATVWRVPAVQDQQKTKRSQRETLMAVRDGYATALAVAQRALQKRGRHWALLSVVAAIKHDQINFGREVEHDSGFAEGRKLAFAGFAEAAAHYAETADTLRLDQETIGAFDTWFYAALGASDLGAVDQDTVLAKNQLPLIRAAIDALPKASAKRHLDMFANQLFTRMSAVKPQIKFRYLEAGFAVVGDHPQAREAKKVWDYYQDLLHELRLEAVVDGPTAVGTQPFGVRVDIVHSPEIARESGGFAKYATNQNNQSYAYNYGRPLENYRDRFTEAVTASLQENFEVISVTFNGEGMQAKPTSAPGWEATPYAYLLLKARGPQVDRVPTIQLDFDFLDPTGFAVLPIGSGTVAIDASAKAESRPFTDLEITQLLDQRRADEGKITLEVKAKAKGLVPNLEQILKLELPGFVVQKRDDQGVSVNKFADDQSGVESERIWLMQLAAENEYERPNRFVFGRPLVEGTKAVYQRYDDADLATVSPEVALSGLDRRSEPIWVWVLLGLGAVAYTLWFLFVHPQSAAATARHRALELPKHLNAFTVLGLLQRIGAETRLDEAQRRALADDLARIEACHFGRGQDPTLDLEATARRWLQQVG